jgi:hypothetical protein
MTARAGASADQATRAEYNTHGPVAQRTGREILALLVELTPPPPAGAAVEDLLVAFEAIIARRAAVIATIAPPIRVTDDDRALVVELDHRQAAWQDALMAAQRSVGEQRCRASQLRAYAARP